MDMISFGPVIEGAHSPDECVNVGSVGRFYRLLTETLAELARV
jgi:dipeptidase D